MYISPSHCLSIFLHKTFSYPLGEHISQAAVGIFWNLRLPRVLIAWLAGAALAMSGAVMQSVLKNPLASSFTLGVSSGASLGAALVLLGHGALPLLLPGLAPAILELLRFFSVPVAGFICSLITMMIVIRFSRAIDPRLDTTTVILTGMIVSLFISAILTLLSALARQESSRLLFWQMGSFALKGWEPLGVLTPILLGIGGAMFVHRRELDIMTFGDEHATSMGLNVEKTKKKLIMLASILTGCTIAFTGIIGFLDLAVPHGIRRLYGPSHATVLPFSAIFGGALMVIADCVARTIFPPLDLPVGAITALFGAPFFAAVYFRSRKNQ